MIINEVHCPLLKPSLAVSQPNTELTVYKSRPEHLLPFVPVYVAKVHNCSYNKKRGFYLLYT